MAAESEEGAESPDVPRSPQMSPDLSRVGASSAESSDGSRPSLMSLMKEALAGSEVSRSGPSSTEKPFDLWTCLGHVADVSRTRPTEEKSRRTRR